MMLGVHMILLNSPDYVYKTNFKYIHIYFEYYLALESSKYMYYMIYIISALALVMHSLVPRLHSPAFYRNSAIKSWGVESGNKAKSPYSPMHS